MINLHLILMRHGVSEWYASSDFTRTLVPKAAEAIHSTTQQLHEMISLDKLQLCYVSPATRTQQSYHIMQNYLQSNAVQHQVTLDQSQELYLASVSTLIEKLYTVDLALDHLKTPASSLESYYVMMLAHNPGLSDCIYQLSRSQIHLQEAEAVVLQCILEDWTDVSTVSWNCLAHCKP